MEVKYFSAHPTLDALSAAISARATLRRADGSTTHDARAHAALILFETPVARDGARDVGRRLGDVLAGTTEQSAGDRVPDRDEL
jgi:hypothetical protein